MAGSEQTLDDHLFSLDEDATRPGARQLLAREELLAYVSALMQSCEGCESVSVVDVMALDRPDRAGCNWSYTIVLDTAGVAPEVYALAYAQVISTARGSWNLG